MTMTQEKINKDFTTSLGEQCSNLFSTSDDRVFIRKSEAIAHSKGQLDPNTKPLSNSTIIEWFNELI